MRKLRDPGVDLGYVIFFAVIWCCGVGSPPHLTAFDPAAEKSGASHSARLALGFLAESTPSPPGWARVASDSAPRRRNGPLPWLPAVRDRGPSWPSTLAALGWRLLICAPPGVHLFPFQVSISGRTMGLAVASRGGVAWRPPRDGTCASFGVDGGVGKGAIQRPIPLGHKRS